MHSRRPSPCTCEEIRRTMEYRPGERTYSALAPDSLITLAHFSVSSAMNFPKSAGVPTNAVALSSANRALISELDKHALIPC
jgi:hypothetical protein